MSLLVARFLLAGLAPAPAGPMAADNRFLFALGGVRGSRLRSLRHHDRRSPWGLSLCSTGYLPPAAFPAPGSGPAAR